MDVKGIPPEFFEPELEFTQLEISLLEKGERIIFGRTQEFARLESALLGKGNRVVQICGAAGTGKTALARAFAEKYRDSFPGGVVHLRESVRIPWEPRPPDLSVLRGERRRLLLVDGFEGIIQRAMEEYVAELRDLNPNTAIVVIRRSPLALPNVDASLRLGGLSFAATQDLIANSGSKIRPEEAEILRKAVEGNPRALQIAANVLREGKYTLADFLAALPPIETGGIVDANGRPISSGSDYSSIVSSVSEVSEALLDRLSRNPRAVYELTPRKFEEVTAELLIRQGFDVTLTPFSKDGGKDIYVATNSSIGSFMYLVECKLYAPHNTVGIDLVQRLYGVVQAERATAGIFVTTSTFTGPAKGFQSLIPYQLSLVDYLGIQKWLQLPKKK